MIEHQLATTPTGSKVHVVDLQNKSVLALGTRGASDYRSLCGEVPESWDTRLDVPDDYEICARCARQALQNGYDVTGADESDLQNADTDWGRYQDV